jgi:hypothetical protein
MVGLADEGAIVRIRSMRGWLVAAAAAACLVMPAATAPAADPGRWVETGRSTTSVNYWQGVTFAPLAASFYFDGVAQGLWKTDVNLNRTAGVSAAIPASVRAAEGYNHLGDLSFDPAEGGRVLLPLECYSPTAPDPNTCHKGGIGVADPLTLQWRYYVNLDAAQIDKAMWVEVSPDGRWLWTSSGRDLLAYDAAAVTAANGAPAGPVLRWAKRAAGVLPVSGVSGATFHGGRLFVAVNLGTVFQVLSYAVDPATGDVTSGATLEIERTRSFTLDETEGLATANARGGELHWQIQPGHKLSGRLIHFKRAT